jgi:hypothetical protein
VERGELGRGSQTIEVVTFSPDLSMKIFFQFIAFFFFTSCVAQKIEMYRSFGGVRYSVDSSDLSSRQVLQIMKKNEPAYNEFKKSIAKGTFASALGFSGGLLIGLPIGSMIGGGDPQWEWVAVGGALIAIAVPIDFRQKRQAQRAVDLYNNEKVKAHRIKTNFYLSASGVGFVLRF